MNTNEQPQPSATPSAVGNGLVLRDVYEKHWEFVWRALRALGVRSADLEDQTHEVFIVVHRKLHEFEGRAKLTTWLFAIAERVASDYRKKAHIRREQTTEDVPESQPMSAYTEEYHRPDNSVERSQARSALEWILQSLPQDQRVVFALFELDGIAAEEIADLVGCPLNTVYSRLRLARKHVTTSIARLRVRGGW